MQVKPRNKFKNLNEEELYDLIEKAVQSADIPNKNAKKNNRRHCFSLARQDKIRARSSTLPARQNMTFNFAESSGALSLRQFFAP